MGKGDYLGGFEQLVLLAILRLGDDAYGVKVLEEIEKRTGKEPSIGAVYTTLDRLEEKGLLKTRTGDPTPERGGRAKKFFAVSGAGCTALSETRATMTAMWRGVRLADA